MRVNVHLLRKRMMKAAQGTIDDTCAHVHFHDGRVSLSGWRAAVVDDAWMRLAMHTGEHIKRLIGASTNSGLHKALY